jgi:hypothetical protein
LKSDAGDDTIWAGDGNDRLCGGLGADSLWCDFGQNEYYPGETTPAQQQEDFIGWGCQTLVSADACSAEAFAAW